MYYWSNSQRDALCFGRTKRNIYIGMNCVSSYTETIFLGCVISVIYIGIIIFNRKTGKSEFSDYNYDLVKSALFKEVFY